LVETVLDAGAAVFGTVAAPAAGAMAAVRATAANVLAMVFLTLLNRSSFGASPRNPGGGVAQVNTRRRRKPGSESPGNHPFR
jgi:hypothetical protein